MISTLKEDLFRLVLVVLMTLCNVFVAVTVAGVIMLWLMTSGVNKYLALTLAIMIAISIHVYINYNHKLMDYVKFKKLGD